VRRWRTLWRRRFSFGAGFAGGLRHDQRRGLGMRRRAREMHRRKGSRSKQRETKVCHDGLNPWKKFGKMINE
jgi:hypothetical protein